MSEKSIQDRLSELSPEQREKLLRKLKEQKKGAPESRDRIKKCDSQDARYPLSFAQQRLWFLHNLDIPAHLYNIPMAIRLDGPLHINALRAAIEASVHRHQILRSVIVELEQGARVEICEPTAWFLPIEDISSKPEEHQQQQLQKYIHTDTHHRFDLTQGPLLKTRLLRFDAEHHVLLVTAHHIVFDGWSIGVFFNEISISYNAYLAQRTPQYPQLKVQYVDYAHWQRQWLSGDRLKKQVDYWRAKLAQVPLLELPMDHMRPAVQRYLGAAYHFEIPAELTQKLKQFAKIHRTTMFTLLLASYKLLLYRYSRQTDICVGTPTANRTSPELEPLVGFFVNNLALRSDLSGAPTFLDFLSQVRSTSLEAMSHQDLPFERLVDALKVKRTMSVSPIFQSMFIFQNMPMEQTFQLTQIKASVIETPRSVSRYDLSLALLERDAELVAEFEFNSDLFEPQTILGLARAYMTLLAHVVSSPELTLDEYPLISPSERELLIPQRGSELENPVPDLCLHEKFEACVSVHPDQLAVVSASATLTYEQLDQRANQLAHQLRDRGVDVGHKVALCVPRDESILIGVLGILKCGALYVPIEPSLPTARKQFILEDAGIRHIIITESDLMLGVDWEGERHDFTQLAHHSSDHLKLAVDPGQAAYMIYTSGTTGVPKGVMVSHHNVQRLFLSTQNNFNFSQHDVWMLFHSYAFDFSVWEIWGALLVGGKLIVPTYEQTRSPTVIRELLIEHRITILNQTPSAFSTLIEADAEQQELIQDLRCIIFGGEALNYRSLSSWVKRYPLSHTKLINMYGITETTVHVTYHEIRESEIDQGQSFIGEPIADLQLYLLDEILEPVPQGVTGEIYVGGEGVTLGYHNRTELNQTRFIDNPFGPGRLYKSGDLGRRNYRNQLIYLGRSDKQVKLRGFRIEIGEIEAAIQETGLVSHQAVVLLGEAEEHQRLVAYVRVDKNSPHTITSLKQQLKLRLPDYMVPSLMVPVTEIPVTVNGKIDYAALPSPVVEAVAEEQYKAPTNHIERALVQIWLALLPATKIGITDNFFDLGGDSILTIQMVGRAKRLGIYLTPKMIFQHQTIQTLVSAASTAHEVPAEQGKLEGSLPVSPIQRWFFELRLKNPHQFNQALWFQLDAAVSDLLLEQALNALLAQHDILRVRVDLAEPVGIAYQPYEQTQCLEIIELPNVQSTELKDLLMQHSRTQQASLNLESGPLFRFVRFSLPGDRSRLLMVFHHLVMDGVSWRIILEDLELALQQGKNQASMQLGAKSSSYRQWTETIEFQTLAPEDAIYGYWQQHADIRTLGLANPDQAALNVVANEKVSRHCLNSGFTQALLLHGNRAYSTQVQELLLCALAQSLTQATGQAQNWIMLEAHGRDLLVDELDLSRTVGWFTALYPALLTYEVDKSPAEQIIAIKESIRSASRYGRYYGLLAPELRPLQQPVQISFNYLGQVQQSSDAELLSWMDLPTPNDSAPENARPFELEISARVVAKELVMEWRYCPHLVADAVVASWAQAYLAALEKIIAHCCQQQRVTYSPVDFPYAQLTQSQIHMIEDKYEQIEDIYPLTSTQLGMWFHSQFEQTTSDTYCEQLCVEILNEFDLDRFRRAWQQLVDRHSILRTVFITEDLPQPLQVVLAQRLLDIRVLDWSGHTGSTARALEQLQKEEREQGFDFSSQLFRLNLVQCHEQQRFFVWTFHHILLDGWSMSQLMTELFALYDHQDALRAQPAYAYGQFVKWLQDRDTQAAEKFWQQYLAGIEQVTPLGLPEYVEVTPSQEPYYVQQEWVLEESLSQALNQQAKRLRITLSTLIQGAWCLLLAKYNRTTEVTIGATVSGRPPELDGIEQAVGLFINTIPKRVHIEPSQNLEDWLLALQQQFISTAPYESFGLAEIHRYLPSDAPSPLFETLVVFENYPVDAALKQNELPIQIGAVTGFEHTNFPLTLIIIPGKQMEVRFSYDNQRFSEEVIATAAGHFTYLLEQLVQSQDLQFSQLQLARETEQMSLLEYAKGDEYPLLADNLATIFAVQVAQTPDAIAVMEQDHSWTYKQLDEQANRLAHYLLSEGVQAGHKIVICMDRCLDFLLSTLAIVKIGAVYVPIHPDNPSERIQYMVRDTAATLILSQQKYASDLTGIDKLVCLDAIGEKIAKCSLGTPECHIDAYQPLYVIYTSGSTGQPKGVIVNHQAVSRLVCHTDYVQFRPLQRTALASNVAFDAATFEIWGPLLNGGTIVIFDKDTVLSGLHYVEELKRNQIRVLFLTPALFNVLAKEDIYAFNELEYLLVGGDICDPSVMREVLAHEPPQHLLNAYGPTENTTFAITYEVRHVPAGAKTIPIGRPIANTVAMILDEFDHLCPTHMVGEIVTGGPGVALGYLNQLELTEQKFVPHPLDANAVNKIYRTGDLGRYRADGNIEIIGRIDRQIKIRGFRVELPEIDAQLGHHANINSAIVTAQEDPQGVKRLVAYVVYQNRANINVADLSAWLSLQLPDYMVPSIYIGMETLPLNPNGKVDRKALPKPDWSQWQRQEFRAAENDLQTSLIEIWQQVLGVTRVGIQDNFFELGGDSILCIQIISRAKRRGMHFTAKQLFKLQTIEQLSQVVRQTDQALMADQGILNDEFELTPIQHWYLNQPAQEIHHFNQSVLLAVSDRVKYEHIEQALDHLRMHHDALRLKFVRDSTNWRQSYQTDVNATLVEPRWVPDEPNLDPMDWILEKCDRAQAELDITQGQVFKALWFESNHQCYLFITIHHLVIDVVSWQILLQDLSELVDQLQSERRLDLGPKTFSYAQWARALGLYSQQPQHQRDKVFWQNWPQIPTLPVDRCDAQNLWSDVEQLRFDLTHDQTDSLLHLTGQSFSPDIPEFLLSALYCALRDWTKTSTFLIAMESHGRDDLAQQIDTSRSVGWFTSYYPILLDSASNDAIELIRQIKDQMRSVPRLGISFGLQALQERSTENAPQAQISFNYLGQINVGDSLNDKFRLAPRQSISEVAPSRSRLHLIDVGAQIENARLKVTLNYSQACYRTETMQALARQLECHLLELMRAAESSAARLMSAADFPLVGLNLDQIDHLRNAYNGIEKIYPLTATQQGMLFHSRLAPESGIYCQQSILSLPASFDIERAQIAWQQCVRHYDVLRTAIQWEGLEQPVQVVLTESAIKIEMVQWQHCSKQEAQQNLQALALQRRQKGFEFNHPPLMALTVCQMPHDEKRLVVTFHHLILDGWSMSLVMQHLRQTYAALETFSELPSKPLTQFSDYFEWRASRSDDHAREFWRSYLTGMHEPTVIGIASGAGNESQAVVPESLSVQLSMALSEQMRIYCSEHHITQNTFIQGIWGFLLSRYSGQSEVLFGTTLSGRACELESIEEMVGMLINTVPTRISCAQACSVNEFLQTIQIQQAEVQLHDSLGLAEIQSQSQIPSDQILFDSIIVFENFPAGDNSSSDSLGTDTLAVQEHTNYPISVFVLPGEQILFRIYYDRQRYSYASITAVSEHLQYLVQQFVQSPQSPLSEVDLISDAQRQQLLVDWNATELDYPQHTTIAGLFAEQVARSPDATAVQDAHAALSYQSLADLSTQLAWYLSEQDIGVGDRVGVCLERSNHVVVSLLAILKAGAAYVPIDPNYPQARIDYVVEHAKLSAVLTETALKSKLCSCAVQHIDVHEIQAECAGLSTAPLSLNTKPKLAYVIYTSGSTGKPKGVAISHRAFVNFIYGMQHAIGMRGDARLLAVTSLSFDIAGLEIWMPLLCGAQVVIASTEQTRDGELLSQLMRDKQIDFLQATPATWQLLLESDWRAAPIRTLKGLCGGEPMSPALAQSLLNCGIQLYNVYGPTETTVWSSVYKVEAGMNHSVSIGRPIANTQFYVLDAARRLVPVGVTGELYIGGDGLAEGYFSRDDLTAERFVNNPFGAGRLYQTGDLARYQSSGLLECLGRIDNQVKVRGFRIELGEIEAVLETHEAVSRGVVKAFGSESNQYLVAFVVPHLEQIDGTQLQRHLAAYLPEYMLPSVVEILDTLPLTPNGKIDRQALVAPGLASNQREYEAPQTDTEQILAALWSELLDHEPVGRRDNFFELGGHSLIATRLASRIKKQLNVLVPLRDLFKYPTLVSQAANLDGLQMVVRGDEPQTIVSTDRTGLLPLSLAQQRIWFLQQLEPYNTSYNLPVVLELSGQLQLAWLQRALDQIREENESLRTKFVVEDGKPFQWVCANRSLQIQVQDVNDFIHEDNKFSIPSWLADKFSRQFDLSSPDLFAVNVLKLEQDRYLLVLVIHHVIADAWSLGVLVSRLRELYSQPAPAGVVHALQYGDYAVWQHRAEYKQKVDAQLHYWRQQLDAVPGFDLPTDYVRSRALDPNGGVVHFKLDSTQWRALNDLAESQGVTLYMLLLSAFAVLLYRHSQQDDFCIGTPIANRTQIELESLVGVFINTLAMRMDLSAHPSFSELLQRTKECTLSAYDHQDVPFEKIVDELALSRDLSQTPLFQVMFNLENTPTATQFDMGNIRANAYEFDFNQVKYDLNLAMTPTEQGLRGVFYYRRSLYRHETIEALAHEFQYLLERIVKTPESGIDQLALMRPAMTQQLLAQQNQTQCHEHSPETVFELITHQIARVPQLTALVCADEQLSYGQLGVQIDHAASVLIGKGVQPGDKVVICAPRGMAAVIAMLAVWRAGAAYVPIESAYPTQRKQEIYANAGASLVVTDQQGRSIFDELNAPIILLHELSASKRDQLLTLLPTQHVSAEQLAYVIYTSGTTGKPKGVAVDHKALSVYVQGVCHRLQFEPSAQYGMISTLCADLGLTMLFPALSLGGTLHLLTDKEIYSGQALADYNRAHKLDYLKIVPSHFKALLNSVEQDPAQLIPSKALVFGGESLDWSLVETMRSLTAKTQIVNHYGPTESVVGASTFLVQGVDSQLSSSVPIGTPLPNQQLYLLDEGLHPVPLGARGEIYIGGDSLAAGYLGDVLSTERAFSAVLGEAYGRLYRTGDLGRRLASGAIEFLGRKDRQVKIRGFRIELNEIHAALLAIAEVAQAFICVQRSAQQEPFIVAYLVMQAKSGLDLDLLKGALQLTLPHHMMPSVFVTLDKMPLTLNGKINESLLPPADLGQQSDSPWVEPQTDTEVALAQIWQQLLGHQHIGREQDFFALGGHSLLAVQLLSRIRALYQVEISLKNLFEYSQLHLLAELVDAALWSHQDAAPDPAHDSDRDEFEL